MVNCSPEWIGVELDHLKSLGRMDKRPNRLGVHFMCYSQYIHKKPRDKFSQRLLFHAIGQTRLSKMLFSHTEKRTRDKCILRFRDVHANDHLDKLYV